VLGDGGEQSRLFRRRQLLALVDGAQCGGGGGRGAQLIEQTRHLLGSGGGRGGGKVVEAPARSMGS